jgi:FkbM family methyltransferase
MAAGDEALILLKNLLYHCVCLGSERRYFALKASAVRGAARLGLYEAAYIRRLPCFVRRGSEVIDVGANFGAYTVGMARLVGPTGKVFAFEPLPPAADVLASTCAALANVEVFREALSGGAEMPESVELRVPLLPGAVPEPALAAVDPAPWEATGLKTWKVFRVPVRRLDDHLAGFRDVSFIKVDVEGHELAFLTGATETIRRFRPVLQLEAGGLRAHAEAVRGWMRDAQYVVVAVHNGRLERAPLEAAMDLNLYAIPGEMVGRLPAAVDQKSGPA